MNKPFEAKPTNVSKVERFVKIRQKANNNQLEKFCSAKATKDRLGFCLENFDKN